MIQFETTEERGWEIPGAREKFLIAGSDCFRSIHCIRMMHDESVRILAVFQQQLDKGSNERCQIAARVHRPIITIAERL
jgi:hypothetical protein